MLRTGNQLKAARALAGIGQEELARLGSVNVQTIRRMEGAGADAIPGRATTRDQVQTALERLGIEFLNGETPGVRLRAVEKKGRAKR